MAAGQPSCARAADLRVGRSEARSPVPGRPPLPEEAHPHWRFQGFEEPHPPLVPIYPPGATPQLPLSARPPGAAALDPAPLAAAGPHVQSPQAAALGQKQLDAPIDLFIRERSVEDALTDVARVAGLRIRVNDRIRASITRTRLAGTVRQVLDELARRHNLTWFAERDLLDVSRADSATVKTFQIGRVTDSQIREAIRRFGLINADSALEVDEANGIARVFAPPRLSSRLESIIVGLRAPSDASGPVEVIRFGLREQAAAN